MPLSSSEIASMNGGFQSMAMNQMAYASMIGQRSGYHGMAPPGFDNGYTADAFTGGVMNRMSAVGAPVLTGAMGLLGLDPLSIGLSAGMKAYGAGAGLGGAVGIGAATALPVAAGLAAAGYATNQMFTGAQQQMGLNNALRSSFNFQNQYGGTGFTRGEMSQVGGMLRTMTEQLGPGGEIATFRELSQLTAKFGQMGLAQGVRDVQEFGRRFKETVTALKTMAKDLGTTLEGALEFASAARGSGIFGINNAARFTQVTRQTAVAGGLAVSEVTGAANAGSQIARSIGGLGAQGAAAGIRTIGQIGTAQQLGVLSEEDIYNVTGMTGAEGRQAFAVSQLQRTAGFLHSGRGRRVLASLADRGGNLREDLVQQLLTGGMTIGQTMSHDRENLARVGRADFIRNEGRLRGATMARIGGFLPALQMMEWASSKGIDINDLDDRSMVFAQRQLHMGRDEVDQAVRMAQSLPQIMRQQRLSAENDTFAQEYSQHRKQLGIQGLKLRFDQAREHVNGRLQKAGQAIFNEGSEMVESFFNKIAGQYVQVVSEQADRAFQSSLYGGSANRREFETFFGGPSKRLSSMGNTSMGTKTGAGTPTTLAAFTATPLLGQSALEKYKEAGFNLKTVFGDYESTRRTYAQLGAAGAAGASAQLVAPARTGTFSDADRNAALQTRLQEIADMTRATNQAPSADLLALGKENAKWLNDFYATGLGGLKGEQRVEAFGRELERRAGQGTSFQNADLFARWQTASPVERVRMMSGLESGAGVDKSVTLRENFRPPSLDVFSQQFTTEDERREAFATALLGETKKTDRYRAGPIGAVLGGAVGTLLGVPGMVAGAALGAKLGGRLFGAVTGEHGERLAAGETLASEEYHRYTAGVFSDDARTREQTRDTVVKDLQRLSGDSSDEARGRRVALQGLLASEEFQRSNGSEDAAAAILDKYKDLAAEGVQGASGLKKVGAAVAGAYGKRRSEYVLGEAKRRQRAGEGEWRTWSNSGFASVSAEGKVAVDEAGLAASKGIKGGADILQQLAEAAHVEAGISTTDPQLAEEQLKNAAQLRQKALKESSGLSAAEKRRLAAGASPTGAGLLLEGAALQEKIGRASRRGGLAGAAAGLGVGLSREELAAFGKKGMSLAAQEDLLLGRLGATNASPELRDQVGQMLLSVGKNNGEAARLGQGILTSEEVREGRAKQKQQSDEERDPFGKATVDKLDGLLTAMKQELPKSIATAIAGQKLQLADASNSEDKPTKNPPPPGGH